MKTSELIGTQLDWAVAKCEHPTIHVVHFNNLRSQHVLHRDFYYSTDWSQGGPLIERELAEVVKCQSGHNGPIYWEAGAVLKDGPGRTYVCGPTPLIAAMRAFVASKLGDTIDIPKELT